MYCWSLKYWSGQNWSNRTGSSGPVQPITLRLFRCSSFSHSSKLNWKEGARFAVECFTTTFTFKSYWDVKTLSTTTFIYNSSFSYLGASSYQLQSSALTIFNLHNMLYHFILPNFMHACKFSILKYNAAMVLYAYSNSFLTNFIQSLCTVLHRTIILVCRSHDALE